MLKCHLLHIKIMYIYKRIYEYFFSQLCRQFHIQVQTGYHWLIQACHMDLASVHFHNVSVFCKNERYLCSIYLMWVVLLQCAVLNILCNDSTNHILHLYYCKFPYKAWGKFHWNPNARPYIVTLQGTTSYWTHCYFKLILCYVLQGKCTLMVT